MGFYFRTLKEYGGVNFTRIDLALDDYDETVRFSDIEKKLNKGIIVHLVSPTISLRHQTKMANHWDRQFISETLGLKMEAVAMCMLVFMTKKRSMKVRTNYFQPKSETIGRGQGKKFGNVTKLAILKIRFEIIDEFLNGDKSTRFLKRRFVIFLKF